MDAIENFKKLIEGVDEEHRATYIEFLAGKMSDSTEEYMRIKRTLESASVGHEQVDCTCGATSIISDEEVEALHNGTLACGACRKLFEVR